MPEITAPTIRSIKTKLVLHDNGVGLEYTGNKQAAIASEYTIPNVLGYIQNRTELTRSTIMQIMVRSGRLDDMAINPQLFMDTVVDKIKRVLQNLMIDGIEYHKIGGSEYEMRLFEEQELEIYVNDYTFRVSNPDKTIYEEFVPLDSDVEWQFAKDCETNNDQIKFYFKLPSWFKIPTPIGSYNPDWAVVFEDDKWIYFVAETKDTGTPKVDLDKLHPSEKQKILCGMAHFKQFENLEYRIVSKVSEL